MICALSGAAANGLIVLLEPSSSAVVLLRFLTGVALAGVYPVGMKMAAGGRTQVKPLQSHHGDLFVLELIRSCNTSRTSFGMECRLSLRRPKQSCEPLHGYMLMLRQPACL